ncbi:MAG: hypothetical protein ACHQQQ_03240 [Bacteroidota bacterium]
MQYQNIKYLLILASIVVVFLNISCRENPSAPNIPVVNFSFKIVVQDSAGHPVPGMQIKVSFKNSLDPFGWSIPYVTKIAYIATDTSTSAILAQTSAYVVVDRSGLPDADIFGVTKSDGSYSCSDSLRFPVALKQLDNAIISMTTTDPAERARISYGSADSVQIILRDTLTGKQNVHYQWLTRGANEFHYTWNPSLTNYDNTNLQYGKKIPATPPIIPGDWNSIKFTDQHGTIQTLYFSPADSTLDLGPYELPPPPPLGIFDVRFDTQYMVAPGSYTDTISYPITVQAADSGFPVVVEWNTPYPITVYGQLNYGANQQWLTGTGTITVSDKYTYFYLTVLPSGSNPLAPTRWSSVNPYPNPTNGSSKFTYNVAARAAIRITVYNLRGELLTTLVDSRMSPNTYTVSFDTGTLALDGCH